MTYFQYKKLKGLLPEKFQKFLTTKTFVTLRNAETGLLAADHFRRYVLRRDSLMENRIALSEHDSDEDGILTKQVFP